MASTERIADRVWIVRGGVPRTMNVYLIEDSDGVVVFDGGVKSMVSAIRQAASPLGGISKLVLGHADADHRGAAPGLDVPTYCHADERGAAESDSIYREYWEFDKLGVHGRFLFKRMLPQWDGGPVSIAGCVNEGDVIAGFRVVHFPGHAPGLIGLFRDSDRLALVSDCIYTLDPQTGIKGRARVPHRASNYDTSLACTSVRKLAALAPKSVWPGHAEPVLNDVAVYLERAAARGA
jgi:hydroxyacylglutathione hydrolase